MSHVVFIPMTQHLQIGVTMSDKMPLHYYVNMPGNTLPGTSFTTIGEALASLPEFPASECEKKFPAPVSDLPPVIVHIGEGIYREKLVINRPNYSRLRRCRL